MTPYASTGWRYEVSSDTIIPPSRPIRPKEIRHLSLTAWKSEGDLSGFPTAAVAASWWGRLSASEEKTSHSSHIVSKLPGVAGWAGPRVSASTNDVRDSSSRLL